MSVVSKHVSEVLKNKTCRDLLHPHTTCKENLIYKILLYPDHFKTIFPFFLINLFLNRKRFKNSSLKAIWDCFKHVMPLSIATYNLSVFGNLLMCSFWHYFDEFRYYYALWIPCVLCTLTVPMSGGTDLMTSSFVNFTIEILIKQINFSDYKYLVTSRIYGAIAFALLSGFISCSYKNDKLTNAWIINPMSITTDTLETSCPKDNNKLCTHQTTCLIQIMKTLLQYLGISLSISIGKKVIFNPLLLKNPKLIFQKFDTKFIKFFTFYAGLFRIVNCLSRNNINLGWSFEKFITGFFSGLIFGVAPQKIMFSMAAITAGKYFWRNLQTKDLGGYFNYVKHLPMHRIVLAYTLGFIINSMIFYPYSAPKFGLWVIDKALTGQVTIAQKQYAKFIFSPI